eukprot:CAMPEP_0196654786 /NCGR_PEP_ID=MMETSP1086-20130531/4510_1 /TAXON_ID=77921 /ORGANISM="Cyanoptyche  gloeocystis , Strain SAG4.97" /LENGTH=249 /DNA_ID=CAMNT_0041986741 /DNA_START=92 /DNA_END=842 /DNA_ORIENTATION=-
MFVSPGSPCFVASAPKSSFLNNDGSSLQAVKVCGITSEADARDVISSWKTFLPTVQLYLGMILWPKAPRSIDLEKAQRISDIAHEHDVKTVGVFVDETSHEICEAHAKASLDLVQLHGEKCRRELCILPQSFETIYVCDVNDDGSILNETNSQNQKEKANWILFDRKSAGSGRSFDWTRFERPASSRWILAGGLSPENVQEALRVLDPPMIDVASGVCGPDKVRKDPEAVELFFGRIHDHVSSRKLSQD